MISVRLLSAKPMVYSSDRRLSDSCRKSIRCWLKAPASLLAVFVVTGSSAVHAQTITAVGVAKASELVIKSYDPIVRDISVIVPAAAGTPTACSKDQRSKNSDWEAFYCRLDRKILISQRNLNLIENRFGYIAIATLVAHEMAHGRQHALTGFMGDIAWSAVFDELQADCIAGVYMRRASPLPFNKQDIQKARTFLVSIGDYSFQERNWHGTPSMRGSAFTYGYDQGSLDSCLASGEMNWRKLLDDTPLVIENLINKAPATLENLIEQGFKILEGR